MKLKRRLIKNPFKNRTLGKKSVIKKQESSSSANTENDTSSAIQQRSDVKVKVIASGIVNNDRTTDLQGNFSHQASERNKTDEKKTMWNRMVSCFTELDYEEEDEKIITLKNIERIDEQQIKLSPKKQSTKESIECIYEMDPKKSEISYSQNAKEMNLVGVGNQKNDQNNIHTLPPLDSKSWPQTPLLFRPKPNSGTRILGIRKDASSVYLWTPEDSFPWWKTLQEEWGQSSIGAGNVQEKQVCNANSTILPINNGNEAEGESLVADFETDLFRGSLLLRLRYSEGTTKDPSDDTKGFFAGTPLRYQATIRGKFKVDLPWLELMTGTRLDRRIKKVPPKWLMWTALKVLHFFAPQLNTQLDCQKPYSVSPLGSAPRTVTVDDEDPTDFLGDDREEPTIPKKSLTGKAYPIEDALERARARKKHFDKMFGSKKQEEYKRNIMTGTNKTYTFQFLQHLLDYQKASIDLGKYHFDVRDLLDGQPLQLMAEHSAKKNNDESRILWAFEIWNDLILEDAKKRI